MALVARTANHRGDPGGRILFRSDFSARIKPYRCVAPGGQVGVSDRFNALGGAVHGSRQRYGAAGVALQKTQIGLCGSGLRKETSAENPLAASCRHILVDVVLESTSDEDKSSPALRRQAI